MRSINKIQEARGEYAQISALEVFLWFVVKEKAIYNALNCMKNRSSTYICFLWAPLEQEINMREQLSSFQTTEFNRWRADVEQPHHIMPPTYFKLNDVTWVFQQITNTYGVPTYEEANPAVFSVVTFPFLFAVMYSDYGHGSLYLFLGLLLIFLNDRLSKIPAMQEVLKLRYMLTMMGFFSCYNGLLYNEFFSISNDWFGSCYNYSTR